MPYDSLQIQWVWPSTNSTPSNVDGLVTGVQPIEMPINMYRMLDRHSHCVISSRIGWQQFNYIYIKRSNVYLLVLMKLLVLEHSIETVLSCQAEYSKNR